ncbi:hypothetical protein V3C99_007871 [Haemonchus contortus]
MSNPFPTSPDLSRQRDGQIDR